MEGVADNAQNMGGGDPKLPTNGTSGDVDEQQDNNDTVESAPTQVKKWPVEAQESSVQIQKLQNGIVQHVVRHGSQTMITRLESRLVTDEELDAEVKTIYTMVRTLERRCMEAISGQPSFPFEAQPLATVDCGGTVVNDKEWFDMTWPRDLSRYIERAGRQCENSLNDEQFQAITAMHRAVLDEYGDFFLATQYPRAPPAFKRLPLEYCMPARLWAIGIHGLLEFLRHKLPASEEHIEAFIQVAYQMLAQISDAAPNFECTWKECMGDLARYRMAIESKDCRVKEAWTDTARELYSWCSEQDPAVGRLYHHRGVLEAEPLRRILLLAKGLAAAQTFDNAWPSLRSSFAAFFQAQNHTKATVEFMKCCLHLFAACEKAEFRSRTELPTPERSLEDFDSSLDSLSTLLQGRNLWLDQAAVFGHCPAIPSKAEVGGPVDGTVDVKDFAETKAEGAKENAEALVEEKAKDVRTFLLPATVLHEMIPIFEQRRREDKRVYNNRRAEMNSMNETPTTGQDVALLLFSLVRVLDGPVRHALFPRHEGAEEARPLRKHERELCMKVFDKECDLMNVISGAAYNNPRWLGVVPMYQYIYVTAIFMRFIAARLFTESNSGSEDTEAITEGFCHAFRPDLIALHVNPLLDRFKKDGGEDWNRIVSPAFPRFDSPVEFPRKEPGWSHNILPEEYVLRGLPIALERPLPEKELRESSRAKVGDEEPPKINPEDATRCLPGLNFERQETPLPEGPKPWIATREETRKGVYFPEDYFSNDDGERDRQNLDTLDMSRERWVKTCWIVYRLATSGHWWTWSEDECQVTPVHSEPAADGGSLAEALRQLSETEGSKAAASADRGDVRPAALSDSASWSTVSRVSAEGSGGWDDCSIVESEAGGSVPPLKGYSSLSKAALPWRDDVQVRSVGPQEGEKEPARTSGKKTCGDDTGSDGSLASSYEMI